MLNCYLIPGLGNDKRIFQNLDLPRFKLIPLDWPEPQKGENLKHYALRIAEKIDDSEPFLLLGMSFGSMLAVEIAKVKTPEKLIIISGAKTRKELPLHLSIWKYIPLHLLFPAGWLVKMSELLKLVTGLRKKWDMSLLMEMIRSMPPYFIKRHIHMLANWDNRDMPQNCIHIHGDLDKVIPLWNITNAIVVENGSHFMVLKKGAEVSERIMDSL